MQEIPQELIDTIRNIPENCKGAKYAFAAYEFIKFFSGFEPREHMFSEFPIVPGCPSERRLEWLAASLFMLRDQDIMPELCRRLRERDARSTFFEISAACFCREIGFSTIPSPGLPKRGFDYDFSICIDPLVSTGPFGSSEKVNVEVTELQSVAFDTKRVVSSLNRKRRQLPNDAPNMIFVKLPHEWTVSASDLRSDLDTVTTQFFRTSKRVNVIVFMSEFWSSFENTYAVHYIAFISGNVRSRAERLTICLNEYFRSLPKNIDAAIASPANTRDYPRFRLRDYTEWVDSVLS